MKTPKRMTVFSFMAMVPLLYGLAVVNAHADEKRADLKKVEFVEVPNTPDNRQKYPFLQNILLEDEAIAKPTQPGRIFMGETEDKATKEKLSLVYVDGSLYCGMSNCSFSAYKGEGAAAKEVINVAVPQDMYTQQCGDELALVFSMSGDPAQLAKWVYNGEKFEHKGSYAGVDKVPGCE